LITIVWIVRKRQGVCETHAAVRNDEDRMPRARVPEGFGTIQEGMVMLSAVHPTRIFLCALFLCVVAVAAACTYTAQADQRAVTVMTQNLYQGTEFANIASLPATPTFAQALGATTADYATYVATRFPDRATQT
jgi:hypothetical protein